MICDWSQKIYIGDMSTSEDDVSEHPVKACIIETLTLIKSMIR